MRQVFVQVPEGRGDAVLALAERYDCLNTVALAARDRDRDFELIVLHIANSAVGDLIERVDEIPDSRISFQPETVLALAPPPDELGQQVVDPDNRSPVEVLLSVLSSLSAWSGYLGYSVLAGVVVWIGLITNREFLLVGAMLVAPFGAPAVTTAVATARGDAKLLGTSIVRYCAGILVMMATCALLSLVVGQQIVTQLMAETVEVSATAVLLPLAAGAVGALHLAQAQRASLVSGAAVGLLVAAALAPAAGVAGMAIALGRWAMIGDGVFLLVLQLVGINLTAAVLLRGFGLSGEGIAFAPGRAALFPISLAVTVVMLGGLLALQLVPDSGLTRGSDAQRAAAEVEELIAADGVGDLVDADLRFVEDGPAGRRTLLGTVVVAVAEPADVDRERELGEALATALRDAGYSDAPLVDVTLLRAPD